MIGRKCSETLNLLFLPPPPFRNPWYLFDNIDANCGIFVVGTPWINSALILSSYIWMSTQNVHQKKVLIWQDFLWLLEIIFIYTTGQEVVLIHPFDIKLEVVNCWLSELQGRTLVDALGVGWGGKLINVTMMGEDVFIVILISKYHAHSTECWLFRS